MNLAFVTHLLCNHKSQAAYRNVYTSSDIHRLGFIIVLGSCYDCASRVLGIDELSSRISCAPKRDGCGSTLNRAVELTDHRWDDVACIQVEVVSRTVEIHRQ